MGAFFKQTNFIEVYFIYNVVLISTAQLIQLYLPFSPHFLFHCGLSQDTEYISLDGYTIEWVDGEIIKERGFSPGVEREGQRNWDWCVYTIDTSYKIDNLWEAAVELREPYSVSSGDIDGKGIRERGDMCVHVADSLCGTIETKTK